MSWHTEYCDESTSARARLESDYPYLTTLLRVPANGVRVAVDRLANYLKARSDESLRAEAVHALPYHAVLDPSDICNLKCPLCVQSTDPGGRRRTMIDVGQYFTLLNEIDPHVIRVDLFNWGEPLLHDRFAELARAAATRFIYTRTSSHLSHEHEKLDPAGIVESGLNYLVTSIDGATQDTYEKYRVGGNLSTVLRNLEQLVLATRRVRQEGLDGPLIEWQYLVMEHNKHEIDAARRLAQSIGVDVFRYGGARGRMSTKVLTESAENVRQSAELLLKADHPLSEYDDLGNKRRLSELEGCRWLWGKVAIHPDGGVSPCWTGWFKRHDFGNCTSERLSGTWHGTTYQHARRSALHGGNLDGLLLCDICAHHRSFVPPPDRDDEPLPDCGHVHYLANAMRSAGMRVDVETEIALVHALTTLASNASIEVQKFSDSQSASLGHKDATQ